MGTYRDDMSQERRATDMIPAGERLVTITEMKEATSKSGNRMFVTVIHDTETRREMIIYLVAEPKKRWLLKSLLSACCVPAGSDGVYDWSISDVLGRTVMAIVEHYTEPWINREGVEIQVNKARVTEFCAPVTDVPPATVEDVNWQP